MCIQWTRVIYSVVIAWQSNPPILQFNSPCDEFTSVWSMFVYNTFPIRICLHIQTEVSTQILLNYYILIGTVSETPQSL